LRRYIAARRAFVASSDSILDHYGSLHHVDNHA
jgi:hypothetical protein